MLNKRENKRAENRNFSQYNFSAKNSRGQGLPTSTIILLILGLVILIVLIFGFATGWSAFKNLLSPTNVDSLKDDCNSACGLNQKFSFCSAERTLRVNEDNLVVKTSCAVLAGVSDFAKYSIATCPSITCELKCADIKINSKAGSLTATAGYDVHLLTTDVSGTDGKCFVSK
ncbi:Uncharacterised protein [uncultured archaeon]|nr:Uncharacterised protein [uncultured archaeon]